MALLTKVIGRHYRWSTRLHLPLPTRLSSASSRLASTDTSADNLKKHFQKCADDPVHFKGSSQIVPVDEAQEGNEDYRMAHPIWSEEEATGVSITHEKPQNFTDWAALYTVKGMRSGFDLFSGYTIKSYLKTLDERDMLRRCIFLETVAGVPGFAAAMIRHLQSLRRMEKDNGWIHTLLEEAENERMHLLTFLQLRNPGPVLRVAVAATQAVFTAMFSLAYLISPHFCHRFVGYLEEQAVITYTHILEEIDAGRLPMWSQLPAPSLAVNYWKLSPDAKMRDMISVIRADEAHHRLVNHTLGSLDLNKKNPFKPGE